jgi:hypothetical protein
MPRFTLTASSAAAALLALTLGCARPITSATSYGALPPKASAEEVQVFTDARPQRAHTEVGVIDVKSFGITSERDYGMMILEARRRAARMGADAIIVTRRPQESTTTVGRATPRRRGRGGDYVETTDTQERPRISVIAIAWKEAR